MSEKMNVLFIMTDQQRADHLGCSGNQILKTPNIDSIAQEGIRFENAFVTNPMCMPNRACLLTGLYPNMHGIRCNGINLPLAVPTITQSLLESGYHTHAVGKMHLQYWFLRMIENSTSVEFFESWREGKSRAEMIKNFPVPYYGFNEVESVISHGDTCSGHYMNWLEERAPHYADIINSKGMEFFLSLTYDTDLPEEFYPTTYVTDRTIAFLEKYSKGEYGEKPFFLHCSYPDPHHPVCPPGRYRDLYNPEDIELPRNFNNLKSLYEHKFLGPILRDPPSRNSQHRESTEEEVKKFIAYTYGTIAMIDHGVGQILASLEKFGLADNTMIIYTSDHGDFMGDHGMLLKGPSPFDAIIKVPLLWKVPGMTTSGVAETLVSSIDIPKTILSLLNIEKENQPPNMQGVDITPALKDPSNKVRECCLIEEDEEYGDTKVRVRTLITDDYKLTLYKGLENYGDLFDRKQDPKEIKNLWHDDNFKEVRYDLINKMAQEILKAQSDYPHKQAIS